MGMIYTASFENISITAAQDLFELLTPADAAIVLHEIGFEQSSDIDSEQLRFSLNRVTGAPTSGSGGGTVTPTPAIPGAAAAGSVVERNNTTRLSGGTSVSLLPGGFNVLEGRRFVWTPETRPEIAPSTRLVMGLETAPADAITGQGWLIFEEVGG